MNAPVPVLTDQTTGVVESVRSAGQGSDFELPFGAVSLSQKPNASQPGEFAECRGQSHFEGWYCGLIGIAAGRAFSGSGRDAHLYLLLHGVKVSSFDENPGLVCEILFDDSFTLRHLRRFWLIPNWPPLCIAKIVPRIGTLELSIEACFLTWLINHGFGSHTAEWVVLAIVILFALELCTGTLEFVSSLFTTKRTATESEKDYWHIHGGE